MYDYIIIGEVDDFNTISDYDLISVIETHYKKYAFSACKETPIILAKLGNDAGIYGSARMVI